MGEDRLRAAEKWVNAHFDFILQEDEMAPLTFQFVLEMARTDLDLENTFLRLMQKEEKPS